MKQTVCSSYPKSQKIKNIKMSKKHFEMIGIIDIVSCYHLKLVRVK